MFRQVFYTMAGVVDGVISTKGSPTLAEFETSLAEEDAKFQIMTSPSSEKPNQHSYPNIFFLFSTPLLTRARNNHVIAQL